MHSQQAPVTRTCQGITRASKLKGCGTVTPVRGPGDLGRWFHTSALRASSASRLRRAISCGDSQGIAGKGYVQKGPCPSGATPW